MDEVLIDNPYSFKKVVSTNLNVFAPLYLHGADAQAPVDDKLAEGCRPLVAVAAVHHEETTQVFELSHREVGSQRGLFSFLSNAQQTEQWANSTSGL